MQASGGVLIGQKGVQYGLQKHTPKQSAAANVPAKPSIFGSDSDDEDTNAQVARQAEKKLADSKAQKMLAKAMEDDPSVFQYDEVYDGIQSTRTASKNTDKVVRPSKYITTLLEAAERRKREGDISYERRLLKERVQEDHLYEGKERFVTAAYRKKLEEDKKWMEEERRKEEDEKLNDVRKRGHIQDFYKNLLTSNIAFGTSTAAAVKPSTAPQQPAEGEPQELDTYKPEVPAKLLAKLDDFELLRRKAEAQRAEKGSGDKSSAEAEEGEAPKPAEPSIPEPVTSTIDEAAAAAAARQALKRRNDDDSVAAARARYLARKGGAAVQPQQ